MAKLQTKSDNINPFGGLFPIFKHWTSPVYGVLYNDFGWAHLPFFFLNENTVFMIATAILKNFYLYFLGVLRGRAEGVDCGTRIKRFVRRFVNVPAKWTRSGRMDVLTLYTKRQIYLSLCT
ncbi:MAG: hypothetical protein MJY58_06325 [Bacteroidaceae bacterium]|nr:hypothetical protein [Bacteroidaceae bacterium]